ncbi:putative protein N(5)-glutamine methyltransferase [Arthrobacter sp. zg-Y877]|uniref:putative protein N(5)-glutamine methyltransferase n=1 Tax=Arthrobacter sp. zg-Y877 TaxID=3049074 RepID=UPI0025A3FD9A|nr:putative protein N(5)-glutamine methyltransferase [Arthrobacter sp. zg-Y877]MDM7990307.1 putative protein N(5)-glutamine methyltransferase [Arthrobacter sp. zg-Y877]
MQSHESPGGLVSRLRDAGCVFAEEEALLLLSDAPGAAVLDRRVAQRLAGQPLEQVLGWASFGGLRVALRPGVFVPRRRTEFLAAQAVHVLAGRSAALVVELCCGSGAVAMVVSAAVPGCRIYAVDLHPEAVECARGNLPQASVLKGDLFLALPQELRGRVDVVVANAPYVPTAALATLPREARNYEPAATFDGGPNGLDTVGRIVSEAPQWLGAGGKVLLECSGDQAAAVAGMLAAAGLSPQILRNEETDATVAVGSAPPRRTKGSGETG